MQILPYSYRNPKYRFLAFISKTVTPRYIRPRYQMKEREIFNKKCLSEHRTFLSHSAANRFWKVEKPFFDVFSTFLKKSSYQGIRDRDTNLKSVKFSTKKFIWTFIILSHLGANSGLKPKKRFFCTFFKKWHYETTETQNLL